MADSVRISDMTLATVPYSGIPLFEISLPAGSGEYDTFSTSLDDLAANLVISSSSYLLLTPTSGQTPSIPDVGKVILNPAGVLSSLTLQLPVGVDRQSIRIMTRQRITLLTLTAQGGKSVDWPAGELPQYGVIDFTMVASLNTWVRG